MKLHKNLLVIVSTMLFFACSYKNDSSDMIRKMQRESNSSEDNNSFSRSTKKRDPIISEIGQSHMKREIPRESEHSEIIHNNLRRGTNRESEDVESERDKSIGTCDKICNKCTKICCFCCILDPTEKEEEEEDEDDEILIPDQNDDDSENEQDNPLKMISDYIASCQKCAYVMTGKGNFKLKIKPHKANILENETKYWKNKIPINKRSLYPPIPPMRKDPFIPPNDNRLLSYIKPQTCRELEEFLITKKNQLGAIRKNTKRNNIFDRDSQFSLEKSRFSRESRRTQRTNLNDQEEAPNVIIAFFTNLFNSKEEDKKNETMENISTVENSSEEGAINSRNKLIFRNGLSYDIIDKELKKEQAHYTLSVFSKKNKLLEGYAPPTLLEAITILQQDSLLNDPKFSDIKLYTTTRYNLPNSSSSIAVKYDSANRNYVFYLTNPNGRETGIKVLPIMRMEENPIEDVCCESCTSPVFCWGHSFVKPTYLCYICYSPPVYHCGKVRLRGCNCSISNWWCCYCPTLPCCIYPTSSTCWERHSCPLCCLDPGCKACCICNPGCHCN